MSLWDDLPAGVQNSGALDAIKPVLDNVATPTSTQESDADGDWQVYRTTLGNANGLNVDLRTGVFATTNAPTDTTTSVLEFPDPRVPIELAVHLTGPGGSPDGGVRLIVTTPSSVLRLPTAVLRGALLDAQGQLRADPSKPVVRFLLPALRIRVMRLANQALGVKLLSAT